MAKTKDTDQIIPGVVELDALTEAQMEAEVRQELEAEQLVLLKASKRREIKAKLKRELLSEAGLQDGEELMPITIDLAPHSNKITIDGVDYHHGVTYNFAPKAVPTILEIMYRTWKHEDEISDRNNRSNAYRKKQAPVLRPRNAA